MEGEGGRGRWKGEGGGGRWRGKVEGEGGVGGHEGGIIQKVVQILIIQTVSVEKMGVASVHTIAAVSIQVYLPPL